MTDERLTYRFGPLERRGLLGQLRGGQAAAVATGAAAGILVLDRAPSAAGAFLGTLLVGGSVLIAFAPVGRRTAEEWAPVVLAFSLRLLRGRLRFRSRAPAGGMLATERPGPLRRLLRHPAPDVPPAIRGVRILDAPYRDRSVGVLSELRGRRLTAVLACRVLAFSLLDAEAQERRLARWGLILAGAAAGPIRRIQWIERTAPAQGDELARWLHDERDPAVPLRGTPMIESYLELIGSTTRVTQEHEVLIAVQVDARRVADRDGDGPARRAGRADRAGRAGARGGRGDRARRARGRAARADAANGVRSVRPRRAGGARGRRTEPRRPRRGQRVAARGARALGSLRQRRRSPRDLLDRRLAARRRLADVHGRICSAARTSSGRSRSRSSRSRPSARPARSRPPSRATTPTASCATASASPRPPATARRRRRPSAARPSSPPATRRSGWRGS